MSKFRLLFLIFFTTFIHADEILLDEKNSINEILPYSKIYLDDSKSLTINDIQKKYTVFKENNHTKLSFGYSPDFDVWIRFTLKNTTDKKMVRVLEYANPLTTHLELFDPLKEISYKEGLFRVNEKRRSVNPYFEISLEPNEKRTFYLKCSSRITTMIVELNLWESKEFYNKELEHQSILQLFFGAMLVLTLYNFFIYLFTKDLSYLYYVLYMAGILFHHLTYIGISPIYLNDQESIVYIVSYASMVVAFPAIALALFTKYFIKTKQYPRLNSILNFFLVLVFLGSIYFIYPSDYAQHRNLLPSILLVYLMFVTAYAVYRKNRQAKFIIFGWIIFLSAGMFMYLSSIGVLNLFDKFPYFVECMLLIEAILFSIALSDKINHLQFERDQVNKALIIQQETEKERLSIEVKNKTQELQDAVQKQTDLLKELNHRVKNNMQTIISLVQLQADEIEDENVLDIFMTIQNRISAMSHLHELLYKQSDISFINTYEYFDILVEALQSSYDKDVDITYNVIVDLKVEPAISCGLILNELVINSFKYAFEDEEFEGKIHIELYKEDDIYHLNISDNGIGYDPKVSKNSFGLVLVSTLVEDHLKGTMVTDTKDGVANYITWRENV